MVLEFVHAIFARPKVGVKSYKVDDDGASQRWEQLWGKQIDAHNCCIPFFTWNMDLGDEVETTSDYVFTRVLVPSGYKTHRI